MSQNQPASAKHHGLPRALGDGLLLRWATAADGEALAEFNARLHADPPEEWDKGIEIWTRDLMSGRHPTVRPEHFTLVEDSRAGNKIVSSCVLIPQTWRYDDVPFPVGRPELVATGPDYRRRGLVRSQFQALHRLSAGNGDLAQVITGIPWYYRQFGYEMALDLGGSRRFYWDRRENQAQVKEERLRLRPATLADLPLLDRLYAIHCQASPISACRDEAIWRHELAGHSPGSSYAREYLLVETMAGQPFGYFRLFHWDRLLSVEEIAVLPGQSWRELCLFVTRVLRQRAEKANEKLEKPIVSLKFSLGTGHPAYRALGRQLERQEPPYAWYVRLPNLPAFLRHIAPALEKRLAGSVMAGHSGVVRLNFYTNQLALHFEGGRLLAVHPWTAAQVEEGDAHFPDLTFLQLLFGRRSVEALAAARADCYARSPEAAVLLDCLFPMMPANVNALG